MSVVTNILALNELRDAVSAMEAPFSLLPDVKDKNGLSIADVQTKRLELVKQHVQNAGELLALAQDSYAQSESSVISALSSVPRYREKLKRLMGGFMPNLPETPNIDDNEKPFGFAAAIK